MYVMTNNHYFLFFFGGGGGGGIGDLIDDIEKRIFLQSSLKASWISQDSLCSGGTVHCPGLNCHQCFALERIPMVTWVLIEFFLSFSFFFFFH